MSELLRVEGVRKSYGAIEVRAERAGDDLILSVQDTGSGAGEVDSSKGGSGVGLRLTRERLTESERLHVIITRMENRQMRNRP